MYCKLNPLIPDGQDHAYTHLNALITLQTSTGNEIMQSASNEILHLYTRTFPLPRSAQLTSVVRQLARLRGEGGGGWERGRGDTGLR